MSELNSQEEVKQEEPKVEEAKIETKEEVKTDPDVLGFEIRGINTKSGLEKALAAKADAIDDYKKKVDSQLKELEDLKAFKSQFDEEQKAAELKKLEEEKNYEEILKRKESEHSEMISKIKGETEQSIRNQIEKEYNMKFAEMSAKDRLFKMAAELKFRNLEDVELRIKSSSLIDDKGEFREGLAKESLAELAKTRPDLLKTPVVENSAPPSPMAKSAPKEELPKTKQELMRLPYTVIESIAQAHPDEYKKLMNT